MRCAWRSSTRVATTQPTQASECRNYDVGWASRRAAAARTFTLMGPTHQMGDRMDVGTADSGLCLWRLGRADRTSRCKIV